MITKVTKEFIDTGNGYWYGEETVWVNNDKETKKELTAKQKEKIMQALKEYADEDQEDYEPDFFMRG